MLDHFDSGLVTDVTSFDLNSGQYDERRDLVHSKLFSFLYTSVYMNYSIHLSVSELLDAHHCVFQNIYLRLRVNFHTSMETRVIVADSDPSLKTDHIWRNHHFPVTILAGKLTFPFRTRPISPQGR